MVSITERQSASTDIAGIRSRRSRPVTDILQIDLVHAGKIAIPRKVKNLPGKRRGVIKLQRAGSAVEGYRSEVRGDDFDCRASRDARRLKAGRRLGLRRAQSHKVRISLMPGDLEKSTKC